MNRLQTTCMAACIAALFPLTARSQADPPAAPDSAAFYQPPPPDYVADDDVEYADSAADVSFFYRSLAPYGEWISHPAYGWVWSPYDIPLTWRPYTRGHWIYTDYGWTWLSDEPYGWAVYHYGRWYYDPNFGWVWVPGTQWGPAWVDWREGSGYVGWAPLPPDVGVWRGNRFEISLTTARPIRRFYWNFVPATAILEVNVHDHIVRPSRNVNIVNITNQTTNIVQVNNRIVNRSLDIKRVEKITKRPITTFKLTDRSTVVRGAQPTDIRHYEVKGNQVQVYRPKIASEKAAKTPDQVIKQVSKAPVQAETRERTEAERKALEQRMAAERAALEKRQKELAKKPPEYVKPNDVSKWQKNEQDALKEQAEREKKLMERYQQRVQQGKVGVTSAQAPKFRVPTAPAQPPPKTPPPPAKTPEKDKKDKKG